MNKRFAPPSGDVSRPAGDRPHQRLVQQGLGNLRSGAKITPQIGAMEIMVRHSYKAVADAVGSGGSLTNPERYR